MLENREKLISKSFLGDKNQEKMWKNPEAVVQSCSIKKEFLK